VSWCGNKQWKCVCVCVCKIKQQTKNNMTVLVRCCLVVVWNKTTEWYHAQVSASKVLPLITLLLGINLCLGIHCTTQVQRVFIVYCGAPAWNMSQIDYKVIPSGFWDEYHHYLCPVLNLCPTTNS
jgi:hypothetical protein